ncbi:hypothetical protein MHYP_G00187220 [Metynnis hypsauchen]
MLIKEYRIPMPMSVEEYRIAQLYMIQSVLMEREYKPREGRRGSPFVSKNATVPVFSLLLTPPSSPSQRHS